MRLKKTNYAVCDKCDVSLDEKKSSVSSMKSILSQTSEASIT